MIVACITVFLHILFLFSITNTSSAHLSCVSNVTSDPATPNIFLQLVEGDEYNATDVIPPLSTSYNPPINLPFLGGSLFPPGDTLVTLSVTDSAGKTVSCNFTVTNPREYETITQ